MSNVNIILGPPGTGKTTKLLSIIDGWLQSGIKPNEICFVSFTKKAAAEAVQRAMAKFNLTPEDLPFFRTLHSLAFLQLGLENRQIINSMGWFDFARLMGISITAKSKLMEQGDFIGYNRGDRLLFFENLARARCMGYKELFDESDEEVITLPEIEQIAKGLKEFKEVNGKSDFTDLIHRFCAEAPIPGIKKLMVDEAQDLSRCQWNMVKLLSNHAEETYIAGDDDQAIFRWAGADIETWINLPGKTMLLERSYRVPSRVAELAGTIVARLRQRRKKTWFPREESGEVHYIPDLEGLNMDQGQWLLLARNGYLLKRFEEYCESQGLIFDSPTNRESKAPIWEAIQIWCRLTDKKPISAREALVVYTLLGTSAGVAWGMKGSLRKVADKTPNRAFFMEDLVRDYGLLTAEPWEKALVKITNEDRHYFLKAIEKGETPGKTARIRISTIHGAKGGEADNVVLMTDMAKRTYEEYQLNPDDEHRVWYVGVTRTRVNLYVIGARTLRYYDI